MQILFARAKAPSWRFFEISMRVVVFCGEKCKGWGYGNFGIVGGFGMEELEFLGNVFRG